jgi:uncharacterized DUF497 family protein
MIFEWDENKRKSNFAKHSLDFTDGLDVFKDARRLEIIDGRKDYGEVRTIVIGKSKVLILSRVLLVVVVYTDRNGNKRIISVRRANNKEKEKYNDNI